MSNILDRWWSSLGASLSCVVGGMPSERVGSIDARRHNLRVCKSCPECSVHMFCLCRKVWKRACVKWLTRKTDVHVRETQGCMATPKRKHKYEEVRWSLARSSLAVRCAGVSAFRFPIVTVLSLVAITTTHCTVHMSVAWRRGSMGTCNLSVSREWEGHDRLVSQCTWSRRPR